LLLVRRFWERDRVDDELGGALDGLRVVDFSTSLTGAHISGLLADFGADVVLVEPPAGGALRGQPAWPFWGRGKRSAVLDLTDEHDAGTARALAARADVVVETWRPGVAERLGLGYEELASDNARLVYASVTGFGREHPWSQLHCYEPVVMAKLGGLTGFSNLSRRDGPAYVATPYSAYTAAQLALQGVLAALYEREASGRGQRVDTTLVQGILAHDTWNWLVRMLTSRYPGALSAAPPVDAEKLIPNHALFFRLLVGLSADGRWMQFSQTSERLWQAFLRVTELDVVLEDPEYHDAPNSEDPSVRVAFWERALTNIRTRTYDEWLEVFDATPDVWGEIFRHDTELLHHPQLVHDHRVAVVDDRDLGPVLQPGPLVRMDATPAVVDRPAPRLDEHGDRVRAEANAARDGSAAAGLESTLDGEPPLAGVTVLELGTYYAAPYGATLLADLGARVIKIEQLDGDPIRHIIPFPEVGAIKVLQGKESVAVDIGCDEGREIVLELVRRADAVLQSFRAGVAERHGYTADDLLAVNPDLVYLQAPGYGPGDPCGHRPAYAPTIGAGSGLAYRNVGGVEAVPQRPDLDLEDLKRYSMHMNSAAMGPLNADPLSATSVGTALALGLLARRRGAPGQAMLMSMLSTMAHALSEEMVEYAGRADPSRPDGDLYGLSARYRLYRASDGWVFLAAPRERDWPALAAALGLPERLRDDDAELAAVLDERFASGDAEEWERVLVPKGVTCVAVSTKPLDGLLFSDLGNELGVVVETTHPTIGDYPRCMPMVRFSRSRGVAGPAPLCGRDTDAVLAELGYSRERIDDLRAAGVLGQVP
jgi:crotonobetainyl-CoA:carnitine CoA-transferase CaiB-like acyl-CoA transferase